MARPPVRKERKRGHASGRNHFYTTNTPMIEPNYATMVNNLDNAIATKHKRRAIYHPTNNKPRYVRFSMFDNILEVLPENNKELKKTNKPGQQRKLENERKQKRKKLLKVLVVKCTTKSY